ncbi:MAG: S8 family serine peptidase, partial [bacterium]
MKHNWKRLLSVALSLVMLLGMAVPGLAVGTSGSAKGLTWEKVELTAADRARLAAGVEGYVEKPLHEAKDLVRVSIVLDQPSTIDAGYSTMGIAQNKSAVAYRQELKANQALVTKQIMNAIGEKLDVVWNLTLVANVISANVTFDKLEAIKAVPGVKDVVLETRYEPAVVSKDADEPNMSVASDMTGGNLAWAAGYTGAGSKVAIVDTGLDTDHQLFDASALEHALEYQNVSLMTAEDVAAVWDQLNAASFISSAKDTYLNAKVPYAVNYVDADLDVTHDNDGQGEHGSHVAGIAAANRYYPVEGVDNAFASSLKNLMTQGEAPDAQIIVMKVFGKGGGAYDSDYMAAIEDAIVLGADSVNLSLGSASAGYVTSSGYQDIMESLVNSDTVVVMSAGNSYSWAQFTTTGSALGDQYLYSDVGSYDTVGSPGSYTNTLAVASVDNDGMSGTYVAVNDQNIFYTETSGYGNEPMTSIAGEYEYVLVNGTGEDFGDIDLEGKIALCLRGSISFYVKANNAAAKGAVATIIGNNTTGTISMNLSGYEYTAPAVSITQDDFNAIMAAGEKQTTAGGYEYYTGKMTVGSRIGSKIYGSDYFTMSSFSSWGVPGDLSLKPEITAPGGNIYSVDGSVPGGKGYENMSGTSMAAPQVTGLAAVLGEYIRENNLVEKTGLSKRVLTNSLLMSTAEPLKNSESGLYYPVFEQGAGLAKVNEALNATSYVLMDKSSTVSAADGKVKVELGDDPDRTGSYTMSFTLNNLKDEDATYYLDADFFTQDLFAYYAVDENGKYITDAEGKRVVTEYRDTWTTLLDADVTFTVDGEELQVGDNGIDLNGDGIYNKDDAQAVLDYVTSGAALADEAAADFDHDGKITSYDAYLALQYVEKVSFTLPASGAAKVKVDVVLNNIADYDVNGTYVEGFIFAQEADSADGAIGTRHSIPVVGYYGSWSEFKSTDIGSFFEYQTGAELRAPYLATASTAARNMQAFTIRFAGDSSSYVMGGNPVTGLEEDGSYRPERNAISGVSGDTIYGYQFALNRTVAGSLTTITDQDGNELFRAEGGARYGSYYNQNQGRWYNISASETIGYMPLGLADGTVLTISHNFAPEYYLDATGNIDWDSVSSESADTFVVTVDNYAPELVDISSGYNALTHKNGLTISAHDNQYIAGMMIYNEAGWNSSNGSPLYTFGALADAQPDTARSFFLDEETLDLSNVANQHLMVIVSDYAMNMVMYKLNLNYEELAAGVTALTASTSSLKLVPNTADSVSVSAEPWGIDDTVTWSSSDESVAVIAASTSNSAIIMGVDEGTAVITATAVSNPDVTAEIEVKVSYIEDEFNALVWDEDGAVWMSSINTKNVTEGGEPLYTKLTETPFEPALNTITYDLEGET